MDASEKKAALEMARKSLEAWVKEKKRYIPKVVPQPFREKRGCFVTLREGNDLRGCIGFPEPTLPLAKALCEAARAASEDPRFPPVDPEELDKIKIEISVLTTPQTLKCDRKGLPKKIKIGRDGLIVRRGFYSGLLLPQVATEWGFGPEEFLNQTCLKAGLPPGSWLDRETEVLSFQADVFSEDAKPEED